jgi:hypothetical protein
VPTYPSSSLYPSATTYPSAALEVSGGIAAFNGGAATYMQTGGLLVEWFMSRIREKPPLFESTEVITPSGKRYRWAADEPRAENVPRDERWSDIMPGGFETLDQTLPRKPSIDYSDLERLSRITRYDASGNVIWQGRLERAPRVSGDQMAISPSAVGYQAHLEDDKSAKVIYVDRDLSGWGGPSPQRRINLSVAVGGLITSWAESIGLTTDYYGMLFTEIENLTSNGTTTREISDQWYDGKGCGIGSLSYEFSAQNLGTADWSTVAYLSDDAVATNLNAGTDHDGAAGPVAGTVTASGVTKSWALLQTRYIPAFSGDGLWQARWAKVRVVGDHGLTIRGADVVGTGPDYEDRTYTGFYDGDIIGHALSQWCSQIAYTDESLVTDSFVIPHLAFKDPTTVGEIIKQATRFRLRDWAVWEGPLFWLHNRNARGNKWRARVGPTQLEETGPQVDRLWNSIIVQYQDVDGSTRTVGPSGSGVDTESSYLVDDDPENPATKAGITRRDLLTMGVSTPEGAIEVGRRFLEQSKVLDSSGRARIVGHVQDDRGVWHPYSHVRAGDQIAFVDANDSSYRRIVKTDKSRSDRSCSIDLDAPPEGLQALLERLGVVLVPLGL